ncbi:MAG: hypothetical protein J0H99_00560 [Rhodospirillales bacterium]|nr:hypothetical protein [Rhodospirillales bacterium]
MPSPVETVIEALRGALGERVTTNPGLREHHSHGQDTQPPALPDRHQPPPMLRARDRSALAILRGRAPS